MKIRYFTLSEQGQLRKASQAAVQGLCQGRCCAAALGHPAARELRLVSVVCDDDLLPEKVFLLRLSLTGGHFTFEDYLVLKAFASPDCVTPAEAVRHHAEGWPADFFRQLAVALDVPVAALHVPFGVGGPLLRAVLRGASLPTARHLR